MRAIIDAARAHLRLEMYARHSILDLDASSQPSDVQLDNLSPPHATTIVGMFGFCSWRLGSIEGISSSY